MTRAFPTRTSSRSPSVDRDFVFAVLALLSPARAETITQEKRRQTGPTFGSGGQQDVSAPSQHSISGHHSGIVVEQAHRSGRWRRRRQRHAGR